MLMSILDFFVGNTEKISKPDRVKIETFEKAGFIWIICKHSFQARRSNMTVDYVYEVKIKK